MPNTLSHFGKHQGVVLLPPPKPPSGGEGTRLRHGGNRPVCSLDRYLGKPSPAVGYEAGGTVHLFNRLRFKRSDAFQSYVRQVLQIGFAIAAGLFLCPVEGRFFVGPCRAERGSILAECCGA